MRGRHIGLAFLVLGTGLLAIAQPASAAWDEHNVLDHLQGKVGVGITTKGLIEEPRGRTQRGELTINCAKNSTTMFVTGDGVYVGGDSSRVAWKLDNGPVQQGNWNICADNRCAGLWHGSGIPFIKSLFGKDVLKLTIRRYDGTEYAATFGVAGAKEAVDPVGKLCGWLPK